MSRATLAEYPTVDFENFSAEEVLRWGLKNFQPGEIVLACSFAAEDVALVDMVMNIEPRTHVFYLDTDFLFPETYATKVAIEKRYGIKTIQARTSLTPAKQAEQYGHELWKSNPTQCCNLRKVEPLKEITGKYKAWITGIRRDQAPTRANAKLVDDDPLFGLVKLNPLAKWTWDDVWAYIRANDVPYNPLHDNYYPSIGCTHCTRQVMPGEDPRAGRWSGQGKIECGLHLNTTTQEATAAK